MFEAVGGSHGYRGVDRRKAYRTLCADDLGVGIEQGDVAFSLFALRFEAQGFEIGALLLLAFYEGSGVQADQQVTRFDGLTLGSHPLHLALPCAR
ncbi:MAG: hypothetical protein CMM29_00880 [Rhodospirillaceae bacterium]|nr:hypothetical protein [Rhodospirillaceae bacterium]